MNTQLQKITVLPAAQKPDIYSMTVEELCEEFRKEASVVESSFKKLGKIFFLIQSYGVEKPHQMLREHGISEGTISNAMYAAQAWARVEEGALTECEYGQLSWRQMLKLVQKPKVKIRADSSRQPRKEKITEEEINLLDGDLDEVHRGDRERLFKMLTLAQNALLAARDCLEESDREINELIAAALRPIGNARFAANPKSKTV